MKRITRRRLVQGGAAAATAIAAVNILGSRAEAAEYTTNTPTIRRSTIR
jgi:hypothetical protein